MKTNNDPDETFVVIGGPNGARPEPKVFELIRDDMDNAMDTLRLILYQAMFHSERPMFASFNPPPSWIRRQASRVRGYVSTLWLALKGADLREGDGDDY